FQMMSTASHAQVDHLFRHEYARIVAALTARYDPGKIEWIEDAVQEALYKAMKTWPFGQTPDNPSGWLYRVANNHLLDRLRREARQVPLDPGLSESTPADEAPISAPGELQDEQLKMLFAVCHPSLKLQEQLMLSLKWLGGLSTREIARALFKQPEAVKRAITRAREKFREKIGRLDIPTGNGLKPRLAAVLKVLYLIFNEGYKAGDGEELIRKDICEEAIRLGLLLRGNAACNTPELNALLALMCLHTARFDARTDAEGRLVTLEHQDRSRWDAEYLQHGIWFLNQSVNGFAMSEYHILAGIAAHYVTAPDFASTDWKAVLALYDMLTRTDPSPVVALNRAVVVGKVHGPMVALGALADIRDQEWLRKNHLYYVIRAEMERCAGHVQTAVDLLQTGVKLVENKVEKAFLEEKIASLKGQVAQV
ncbi:MAG: sigma-70 family RNA polymerase sigma factor, partial [Bacteroidota bacterium]